eukprot:TRINITY_DN20066_c0_g1_i1.p1 TRINITY_DN20066_c0_g1~~TRINITY_DN20066_c0_g1_i1.p1  ORF type:complete len:163 (+),score=27.85 TRINITY_DN20066_c0_g1_i1:2-490(+)
MDAREIRRQREAMRQQWMAQRAVDMDRESVLSELTSEQQPYVPSCFEDKPPSRVSSATQPRPEEMINRISERMSERLRAEIRVELRREQLSADDEKAAIGCKVEEMLNEDLSANTCLVCFELMVAPERAPMMLFPVGTPSALPASAGTRRRGETSAHTAVQQ